MYVPMKRSTLSLVTSWSTDAWQRTAGPARDRELQWLVDGKRPLARREPRNHARAFGELHDCHRIGQPRCEVRVIPVVVDDPAHEPRVARRRLPRHARREA